MSNTPSWHQESLTALRSSLGVTSVIEALHAAVDIETNHGGVEDYRKTVQRAKDIALAGDISPSLPDLIEAAAFTPLARTGTWMANTPSCHREALLDLINTLKVASISHILKKALAIDTNRGSAFYVELAQQAQEVAAASKVDPALPGRINAAAFKPHPRTATWMSNTPSWHQAPLRELLSSLEEEALRSVLFGQALLEPFGAANA